jgi:diketogulonate reductase-like aldo/keto reductase
VHTRPIPSTGEQLPVIGVGTWENFDVGANPKQQAELQQVLSSLFAAGGSVIDSSPMYGRAEAVVGTLLKDMRPAPKTFIATKVWTSGKREGIEQMQRSMQLLHAQPMDLMQIHNLLDWRVHLETLLGWKNEGRVRYIGITHYTPSAHAELESVMRAAPWDFVQLDYALDDRAAEQHLLPLARERGIAVLVNRPFGGGGLLKRLVQKPLPDWAAELGCTNWAALLLKFILGHPAVTCAIPGTGNPAHMRQILEAGQGPLPDEAMRKKMHALVQA